MTAEQRFFLEVLGDFVCKRPTSAKDGCEALDWDVLFEHSQHHQVTAIVYNQCKAFIPAQAAAKFQAKYGQTLYNYANRLKTLGLIRNKLEERNTEYFFTKGAVVADIYPEPAFRTMGDLDIIVHRGDRVVVDEILTAMGYLSENRNNEHSNEWEYFKNGTEIEVHDKLMYYEISGDAERFAYFNDFWKYTKDNVLDASFHFLYLLLHLRKHLMTSGVGFRQFTDIAVEIKYDGNLDWARIEKDLNRLEMMDFAGVCFGFINRWFGVKAPIKFEEPEDSFFEDATSKIFSDGVFGHENSDNESNIVMNEIREKGGSKFGVIKYALGRIFPSRKELLGSKAFGYLEKMPWLIVFAWIHRIFRGIFRGHANVGAKVVKASFVSKKEMEARDDSLRKWGL